MVQGRLSKDEAGELLDQCVHVVAMTQELCHSTRNFVRMTWYYPGMEGPFSRALATWPCHIDFFKRQYDKAFAGHRLFGLEIVDRIHKHVQVFLHSCNTTSLDGVETGYLAEFGALQRRV